MVKQGLKQKLTRRQAIIQAIDWCISNNVMNDYLVDKRNEVFTMLDLQWNLDEAKVAWRDQGRETERNFIAINLINMGMSFDKIRAATNLSLEHIQKLASQNEK